MLTLGKTPSYPVAVIGRGTFATWLTIGYVESLSARQRYARIKVLMRAL